MKSDFEEEGQAPGETQPARAQRGARRIPMWTLVLVCLAALVGVFVSSRPSHNAPEGDSQGVVVTRSTTPQRNVSGKTFWAANKSTTAVPKFNFAQPSAAMRQLLNNVINFEGIGAPMTDEQAEAWKQRLHQLLLQGADAVPAIREFLASNTDFDFGENGKAVLGYNSARAAMFDALAQIGGSIAVAALTEVLQQTADPREIALLAQHLEKIEPGAHQSEALEAARQTLAMAAQGNLSDKDVAPLFELFKKYGGPAAVADLERTAMQWNWYAMIALAQLPDGAGVPSLVLFANGQDGASAGSRTAALQMLAQLAPSSPGAKAALLDMVKGNSLSAYNWAALGPSLAGYQMLFQNSAFDDPLSAVSPGDVKTAHISSGNQKFVTVPLGAMTPDQIDHQKTFIDELLGATQDPEAVKALAKAKGLLEQRLVQLASTAPKPQNTQ